MKAPNPNHWTTREFPHQLFIIFKSLGSVESKLTQLCMRSELGSLHRGSSARRAENPLQGGMGLKWASGTLVDSIAVRSSASMGAISTVTEHLLWLSALWVGFSPVCSRRPAMAAFTKEWHCEESGFSPRNSPSGRL